MARPRPSSCAGRPSAPPSTPPIPATIKPLILITLIFLALQSVSNLIYDWNKDPQSHDPADDIDMPNIGTDPSNTRTD